MTDRFAKVLARSHTDLSATDVLTLGVDRHTTLSTLLAEDDVLGRESQIDRWTALLDVMPSPKRCSPALTTNASKRYSPGTKPPAISQL